MATTTEPMPYPARARRITDSKEFLPCLMLLILPLGMVKEINLIGQLFVTELILFLLFPLFYVTSPKIKPKYDGVQLGWIGIWLLALMATDIYRGTFIGDYLRGWAKLIFLILNFYVLRRLLTTEARLLSWLIGASIALGIFAWQEHDVLAERWKFGVGDSALHAVAAVVILLGFNRQKVAPMVLGAICFGFALTSILLNSRNFFLAFFLAGCTFLACAFPASREVLKRGWDRHFWAAVLFGFAIIYGIGTIYVTGAPQGWFGEDARLKFAEQRMEGLDPVVGVLAGGRQEFFSSSAAIADSPIIGYGSWARSAYYYNIYLEAIRRYASPERIQQVEAQIPVGEPLIPVHSHIFSAWVEAGIVGAIVWVLIIREIFRAMRRSFELRSASDLLIILIAPSLLWDLLFSPLGGQLRISWAFAFVLLGFKATGGAASTTVDPKDSIQAAGSRPAPHPTR